MAHPNIQQNQYCGSFVDPRISFSNDLAATKHEMINYKEAPVSSDFEFFSVKNYAAMSIRPADQIFYDGVILPLKDDEANHKKMATLREELREDLGFDEEEEDSSARIRKTKGSSSSWWRERLGLGVVRSKKDQKRGSLIHQ